MSEDLKIDGYETPKAALKTCAVDGCENKFPPRGARKLTPGENAAHWHRA